MTACGSLITRDRYLGRSCPALAKSAVHLLAICLENQLTPARIRGILELVTCIVSSGCLGVTTVYQSTAGCQRSNSLQVGWLKLTFRRHGYC
jgi:hypothetical protein